jgi:hypothetical protein
MRVATPIIRSLVVYQDQDCATQSRSTECDVFTYIQDKNLKEMY